MEHSPIIDVKKEESLTLDFPEAIKQVIDGKKIFKLDWKDKEFYGVLRNGQLVLHKADGKFYAWIISEGDLLGTDWVVI